MMQSWGRVHRFAHRHAVPFYRGEVAFDKGINTAYGQGRSYGDVALNSGGQLICTHQLDRLIHFDRHGGVLRAEAGITLAQILEVIVPAGWFLPVTPGSKFVSLGGAVACDVHGKNHHQVGSFGAHVRALSLKRSDGSVHKLTPDKALFALTVSGLGLTGLIEWVEIQLIPLRSAHMWVENRPYDRLEAFFEISAASHTWPYSVAWVDCFARGPRLGRGIYTRARHAAMPSLDDLPSRRRVAWPFQTPGWLLNRASISAFNWLYRRRRGATYKGVQPYEPYFYPLDRIAHWNRLYGPRGFYQHQCLIPKAAAKAGITALLTRIAKQGQGGGQGSFLAVLKNHGPERSPGRNTFCGEGTSLALDFANKGPATLALLAELEAIVLDHGGRIYAAKDGTMAGGSYRAMYPNWTALEAARDPALNSAFWMRVTGDAL